MGKPKLHSKLSESASKRPLRVLKQDAVQKPYSVRYKRLSMLHRRLKALVNEKNTWEVQNKELSDSLRVERLLSASLKKEIFHWQSLYHEAAAENNALKVKQNNFTEVLKSCKRDSESVFPHMVALSEAVTSSKIRITHLLNTLHSPGDKFLQKVCQEGSGINYEYKENGDKFLQKVCQEGSGINYEYKENGKPTKHRVGPMVKGFHIVTKPTIMIERLTLPQAQNQDENTVGDIEVNRLPPIREESGDEEDPRFRHVSVRPRRSKLGTSWRRKREEQLKKDQERERIRENQPSVAVSYSGDSSDSDDVPTTINHVEPVAHFKDVSQLRKNSSSGLHQVDSGRIGDGAGVNRHSTSHHFSERSDDPLEGSSWMYTNCYQQPQTNQRRSSLYKSDSSDNEDDIIVQQNPPDLFSMNTLLIENQTLSDSLMNKRNSKGRNCSHKTPRDCSVNEPDSTNNESEVIINNSHSSRESLENKYKHSSSPCSLSSGNSTELSADYGTANNTIEQLSIRTNIPSVRLSKVFDNTPPSAENSFGLNRHSNVKSSLLDKSHENTGKRVRKPKNHCYPGEDYDIPNSKIKKQNKIARQSTGRKSLTVTVKTNVKKVKSIKRKSSGIAVNPNGDTNSNGITEPAAKTQPAKKRKSSRRKLRKSSGTPVNTVEDTSAKRVSQEASSKPVASNTITKRKTSKQKPSSLKKSIATPDHSRESNLLNSQDGASQSRPRRNKSNVCYKEPNLNEKKRRT